MQKTTVVCVDLDGTVSDGALRQHLKPPKGSPLSEWRAFHQACAFDMPFPGIVLLLRALAASHQIHFVSGRFVEMQAATEAWLTKHAIPYDALRLYGPTDSPTKNEVYKSLYLQQLKQRGLTPVLFIEDEGYVADYIESTTGLPVLCVNPGYGSRI